MAMVDTVDGALMSSLYLAPMGMDDSKKSDEDDLPTVHEVNVDEENGRTSPQTLISARVRSPLLFLYYSTVLTALTVVVAIVIGLIQLLSLLRNTVAMSSSREFWQGVDRAGEYYDIIGGAICASFLVVGLASVLCYKPWRRWVDRQRATLRVENGDHSAPELLNDCAEDDGQSDRLQETNVNQVQASSDGPQKGATGVAEEISVSYRAESSSQRQ